MIVIKDDFYPNPDEVREKALSMFFRPGRRERRTMFPGRRTKSSFSNENFIYCRNQWENMLNAKMQYFPRKNSNTAFTLSEHDDANWNWVHHDCSGFLENTSKDMNGQAYAAVVYLSPNADVKKAQDYSSLYRQEKFIRTMNSAKGQRVCSSRCGKKMESSICTHMLGTFITDVFCTLHTIGTHHFVQDMDTTKLLDD